MRRLARILLAVVASTAVALVAAELAVRALGLAPPERGPSKALRVVVESVPEERAPGVRRRLVPGTEETRVYAGGEGEPDRTVTYRINSLGLRDREVAAEKPPGVRRVCCVGDSFTFGTAVDLGDTWPQALERALAEGPDGAFQVLNCGLEAINLPQEAALLENRVARMEPDLVVVCAYLNDASGHGIPDRPQDPALARRVAWIERLGLTSGVWAAGEERTDAQRRTMAWRRRSALVDLVAHRLYGWLYGPVTETNYRLDWAAGSPGWEAAVAALERMRDLAGRAGFELHVALYPVLTGLDGDYPFADVHARLGEACAALGLPFHDLLKPLAGREARTLHAHAHDAHPNGACNELVGRWLAGRLASTER